MLVLTRKKDESIVIPDLGLTIKVLGIREGRVRLGFDGPKDLDIWRGEIAPNEGKQDDTK